MSFSAEVELDGAPLTAEVYGHFGIPCGLQVAALNTVSRLQSRGWRTRLHTIGRFEDAVEPNAPFDASDVNIFHINPWELVRSFAWPHEDPRFETRLNVCVPFWELPQLPGSWLPALKCMDLVLAPTTFIADAVRTTIPGVPVVAHPQAVSIPEGILPDRGRFGLPTDAFIFGLTFAVESPLERKNPHAAITAFQLAFPEDEDVRLVVRASPGKLMPGEAVWAALREFAGDDPRVIIHNAPLGYEEVLSLYASFDAFVSLHRSEGLGLGMLESMALGVPVIATAWSGNTDFTTEENSLLVGYDLVPVNVNKLSPYSVETTGVQATWAEPRIEEAAEQMRRLRNSSELHARLSARAAADSAARIAMVQRAEFADRLIEHRDRIVAEGPDRPRARALRRLERHERRMRPYYRARQLAGATLRAMKLR